MIHASSQQLFSTIETESPTKEMEQQTITVVVDNVNTTTKQQTIQPAKTAASTSIISNELTTCRYGLPPLLCASNGGKCKNVRRALNRPGVDVNVRTTAHNFTALMLAALLYKEYFANVVASRSLCECC